jgi:hypothetical protein
LPPGLLFIVSLNQVRSRREAIRQAEPLERNENVEIRVFDQERESESEPRRLM